MGKLVFFINVKATVYFLEEAGRVTYRYGIKLTGF